jgi:hypothetical protein
MQRENTPASVIPPCQMLPCLQKYCAACVADDGPCTFDLYGRVEVLNPGRRDATIGFGGNLHSTAAVFTILRTEAGYNDAYKGMPRFMKNQEAFSVIVLTDSGTHARVQCESQELRE